MAAASRRSIRNHIQRMHLGIRRTTKAERLACKTCNKTFADKAKLSKHIRNIHTEVVKPFECPFCQSRWVDRSSFETHKRIHWDTLAKFPCEHCGKELTSKGNLKAHILSVHEQVRNHHCDICSSSFKCSRDLREHRVTHFDEKPHKCDQCNAAFRRKDILAGHIKTQHSNLPTVQCGVCLKILKSSFTLKEHMKTHSNDVFSCGSCDKKFGSLRSLQKHVRQVHEGERVRHRCLICTYERWSRKQIVDHIVKSHDMTGLQSPDSYVEKLDSKREISVLGI